MARKEEFEATNEVTRKKEGYNPVKGVAMMMESVERDTYIVEVANSGERKVEKLDNVKSTDIMEGKITKIVAHGNKEKDDEYSHN